MTGLTLGPRRANVEIREEVENFFLFGLTVESNGDEVTRLQSQEVHESNAPARGDRSHRSGHFSGEMQISSTVG